MTKTIEKTSLETKFLISFIVNFLIIFPVKFILLDWSAVHLSTFNIAQFVYISLFYNIVYGLLVATIWHILDNDIYHGDDNDETNKSKLWKIIPACIFGSIIIYFSNFHKISQNAINESYIYTSVEIVLCFYIQKLFIFMSNKNSIISKIASFIDNILAICIYSVIGACLLSWIPNINWEFLPLKIFWCIVGSFMSIFKPFIPDFGGFDFSPVFPLCILFFARKQFAIYFKNLIEKSETQESTFD